MQNAFMASLQSNDVSTTSAVTTHQPALDHRQPDASPVSGDHQRFQQQQFYTPKAISDPNCSVRRSARLR